jgi:hypothetical protein
MWNPVLMMVFLVLRPFCGEAKLMLNKDAGKDMDVPKVIMVKQ